jgi:hypothetical protein
VLCIHPSLSKAFVSRKTIRTLFRALGRFSPQPAPAPKTSPEFDLLQAQVCDKCLRLVQQVLTAHTDMFHEAMRDRTGPELEEIGETTSVDMREMEVPVPLVLSVVRVSVGATRNLQWYPALLRSADVLQVSCHSMIQYLKRHSNMRCPVISCWLWTRSRRRSASRP